jgi:hypothetical protein
MNINGIKSLNPAPASLPLEAALAIFANTIRRMGDRNNNKTKDSANHSSIE